MRGWKIETQRDLYLKIPKVAESLQWWYAFDFVNNAKSELLSLKYSYGGIVQNAMFSGSLHAH